MLVFCSYDRIPMPKAKKGFSLAFGFGRVESMTGKAWLITFSSTHRKQREQAGSGI